MIHDTVIAVLQLGIIYLPLVLLVIMLVLRHFRRLLIVLATVVMSAGLLRIIGSLLDVPVNERSPARLVGRGFHAIHAFPSLALVAVVMAIAVVETPWYSKAWRRATWVIVGLVAFVHLDTQTNPPVDLGTALVGGWVAGLTARLIFGRANRRPGGHDIALALGSAGVEVDRVSASDKPWAGSHIFHARTVAGGPVYVKSVLNEDRGGDVLGRVYRWLRLRHVGDQHPFWPSDRVVEHEALLSFTAAAAGVQTPKVLAVAMVGESDGMLMAFDEVPAARTLAEVPDDVLDDDVLRGAWMVACGLRRARLAHRELRLGNLLVDDAGEVWLVGFRSAQSQADQQLLDNDVAELLTSCAARVGPARAVAAAVDVVGSPAVAAALPRLQPLALSFPTRSDLRAVGSLLEDLRAEVCRVTGVDEAPLEQLQRLKPRTLLLFMMSALAVYALLPQLTDASGIWRDITEAEWPWVLGAIAASITSYFAAALALKGSVPDRVRYLPATAVQLASQFANFATPASVGGMALNVRFVQKQGTDAPVAVAAVGLNAVAGVVIHLMLFLAVAVWAGSEDTTSFYASSARTALIFLVVLAVLMALVLAIPAGRAAFLDRGLPIIRRSLVGIADIARRPGKISELVLGSLFVTVAYIAALACAVYAFGGDVPLATIALVFLVGSAVASVAPTPGGLGAVEAAMVAGLSGVGLSGDIAVSSVVVFRFATFWLPLLPGWLTFGALQRRDAI
jgi:undecaprenyl-diphosphatase